MTIHRLHAGTALVAASVALAAGCAPTMPAGVGPSAAPSAAPSGAASPASSAPSTAPSDSPSAGPSAGASGGPSAATGMRRITGIVADIDRNPMPGAGVVAKRGDDEVARTTTDKDGRYTIDLPAGELSVTASFKGYTTRTQLLKGEGDVRLNFGADLDDQANPFFLADTPEVERVEVLEDAPAGPLTLRVHLSEPLPAASQARFAELFELRRGRDVEFLRARTSGNARLLTESTWSEEGKVFTFTYKGPYLPSGETDAIYTAVLDQRQLETKDPVTQELEWTDLRIEDDQGNAIGRGRADYTFKKADIFPPSLEMLTDKEFGYYVQDRRWRLTHEDGFSFTAKRDDVPPEMDFVELVVDDDQGTENADILRIRFKEPMSAARDRDDLEFTRLDKDRPPVLLNVAKDEAGKNLEPLSSALTIRKIEVDYNDPRNVFIYYPLNAFDDFEFVEVTLTPEALDPAGNAPDPKRNRLGGKIVGN